MECLTTIVRDSLYGGIHFNDEKAEEEKLVYCERKSRISSIWNYITHTCVRRDSSINPAVMWGVFLEIMVDRHCGRTKQKQWIAALFW